MSGDWPPEWDDPEEEFPPGAEQQDATGSTEMGDVRLAEVTAYLASVPAPVMPDAVMSRISAALAAEAGARAGGGTRAEAAPLAGGTPSAAGTTADGDRTLGAPPARARVRRHRGGVKGQHGFRSPSLKVVKAVTSGKATLDVKIVQLVKLLRNGEPVKMSKRSGDFVTLREVVDEVGSDAVRFMMLFRKNDAVLDFDLAKVLEQSKDNPVFYVQYGHARGHSIFRNAREVIPDLPVETVARAAFLVEAAVERLTDPAELGLLRQLALYPRLIDAAATAHEPHRIAFYLYDLASEFHALWTRGRDLPYLRFIITDDAEITKARLALVHGVVSVLASGLGVLGVHAPDEMR